MNKSEWLEIAALVGEFWPRQEWPPDSVASSFALVEQLSAKSVLRAVQGLAETGREFAPPPGMVLAYAKPLDGGLALPSPDLIRDLTPEELTRAQDMASRLRVILQPMGRKP
jgi:hypothetical protein